MKPRVYFLSLQVCCSAQTGVAFASRLQSLPGADSFAMSLAKKEATNSSSRRGCCTVGLPTPAVSVAYGRLKESEDENAIPAYADCLPARGSGVTPLILARGSIQLPSGEDIDSAQDAENASRRCVCLYTRRRDSASGRKLRVNRILFLFAMSGFCVSASSSSSKDRLFLAVRRKKKRRDSVYHFTRSPLSLRTSRVILFF